MSLLINIDKKSYFTLENIPFGVYDASGERHICSAIGDYIIDLNLLEKEGVFKNTSFGNKGLFSEPYLNKFMAAGKSVRKEVRKIIQDLVCGKNPLIKNSEDFKNRFLSETQKVKMLLPVETGDYTDFYSSREHATNVGIMFRGKENALMPNWLHLPVGYHGRASSIIESGIDIKRPKGQTRPDSNLPPQYGPTKQLDFELEMGFYIGTGNNLGESIKTKDAFEHIWGMVIVNDWSARDIQAWEYVPLGPFLAKNFATSVSPWVITPEALEPFITEGPIQDPEPLEYLKTEKNLTYDIKLEVSIKTEKMNEPYVICRSNFKYLYWNIAQQLAHHTVNGCNTKTGDLMASGTISGPEKDMRGSMLELTWRGTEPLKLPSGEERKFIEDGDTIIMSAYCEKNNLRIGFGSVESKVLPAD